MCLAGPDYRRGDQHPEIAIVGSCPGAQEEERGRPFIGDAGTNLAEMIRVINSISSAKFPSANRDDYTLLNAHPLPRYDGRVGYDGSTEPDQPEVMSDENLARLSTQTRRTGITRLLLAGRTPQWLTQKMIDELQDVDIFWCGHPSISAWNTRYIGQPKAEKIRRWTQDSFKMVAPFHVVE